jgi:hypothetical protein
MYSLALIIFVVSEKKAFEYFPIGSNVNLCPGDRSMVSSTIKTDLHDITEILLNVSLNTIKQANNMGMEGR